MKDNILQNYTDNKVLYKALFSCFIGKVFQDRLMLFRPRINEIRYNDITCVEYKKSRYYLLNYLLALMGLTLFSLFLFNEFELKVLLIASASMILSIIVKKERSIIKINLRESSTIIIDLKKKEEKKGEIFVKKIKQHLMEN